MDGGDCDLEQKLFNLLSDNKTVGKTETDRRTSGSINVEPYRLNNKMFGTKTRSVLSVSKCDNILFSEMDVNSGNVVRIIIWYWTYPEEHIILICVVI